jgi:hypothetical protein
VRILLSKQAEVLEKEIAELEERLAARPPDDE